MIKWIPGLVVAGAAIYAALMVATGRSVPIVGGGRAAFWTVAALGFAACAPGIGSAFRTAGGNWGHPLLLAGTVLGILAMLVAASVATGVRPSFLATDARALIALACIVAVKVAIATTGVAVGIVR